ncbi:MAG: LysM peptidoglycan-binding domain-containing protein, partial [Myxococcota bacterium]
MSALLIFSLWLCATPLPSEVRVKQGETLADVAKRTLGSAAAASELKALNGLSEMAPAPGTLLKLPGTERTLALSALVAAKNAIEQAG